MTIASWGWQGSVTELQRALTMSMSAPDSVEDSNAWRISQGTGRQASAAVGRATACDVTSDLTASPLTVALGTPANGQFYLIVRRIAWAAKSVTLVAIAADLTSTTVPTDPPADTSGATGLTQTPGTTYDHVLAWAWVNSVNTNVVVFDLRRQHAGRRLDAIDRPFSTLTALPLASQNWPGREVPALSGARYRWDGALWRLANVPRVADAAARDALYAVNAVRQAGDTVWRLDRQYAEEYIDATNVVAGWYPVLGTLPRLFLTRGAAQSIPNNVVTKVVFPPLVGTLITWDNVNNEAVCVVPGRYRVRGSVTWAGGGSIGSRVVYLQLNGATVRSTLQVINTIQTADAETEMNLAVGDKVSLSVLQGSGAAQNIFIGGANYSTEMALQYIGPSQTP